MSFQSPGQNGIAERWVESCRRDLLDHVVAFNAHVPEYLCQRVDVRTPMPKRGSYIASVATNAMVSG